MSKEDNPKFVAYCCGMPMKTTETETHIRFVCATGSHGRWFVMAKHSEEQSQCSHMDAGLLTEDLGCLRLYSCPQCGARYSVYVEGIKLEAHVQGISAEEVNKVGRETISALWDRLHRMGERNHGNFGSLFKKEVNTVINHVKKDIVMGNKSEESIEVQGDGSIGKSGRDATTNVTTEKNNQNNGWLRPTIISVVGAVLAAIIIYYMKSKGIIFQP